MRFKWRTYLQLATNWNLKIPIQSLVEEVEDIFRISSSQTDDINSRIDSHLRRMKRVIEINWREKV